MSRQPPSDAAGPSWPGRRRGSRGPTRGPGRPHPPFPSADSLDRQLSPQKEPSGSPTSLPGVPPPPPGPRNPPPPSGGPNPPTDPPGRR
ncbi:hypothetical protein GCM10009738_65280 [Kitasatospora viridis]|uniref:Uncharacterized protein n=1 Tax=Kitasatospora viridis TaxID=281105 RepID=A0A561UKF8_9ACTN|nr:hypothetical protein FHX73_113707 [Kitasatospora viridis]